MQKKSYATCIYLIKQDSLFHFSFRCAKYKEVIENNSRIFGYSKETYYPAIDYTIISKCDKDNSYVPTLLTRIKNAIFKNGTST